MILYNQAHYTNDQRSFRQADICLTPCPKVDLILCRDCLVHLSFDNIWQILLNFRRSQSSYLLATTYPKHTHNDHSIFVGDSTNKLSAWRALNLQIYPFDLPKPLELIDEQYMENGQMTDKSLGLWLLNDIDRI